MDKLKSPRVPKPLAAEYPAGSPRDSTESWFNEWATKEQRQAAWLSSLNVEGQEIFRGLLEECAELSGFGFFTLIDGTTGGPDGVFESVHVSGDEEKTVLNSENTDMLHDLFSEVCDEDRRHGA